MDHVRIGHLYPSGGLWEHEVQRMAPPWLRFMTTRMPFRATGLADDLALAADLETHASLVSDAAVDLIAFNCTAASMLIGSDVIRERIAAVTGLPTVTTIEAVEAALGELGIRRLLLLNPYPEEVQTAEVRYLEARGFRVLGCLGPGCETPVEQGELPPELWLDVLEGVDLSGVDGLLLSCAGVEVSPVIAEMERRTGMPVVASNQALLWQVSETLGLSLKIDGFGALLEGGTHA